MYSSQILVHFMYIAEKVKESAIKEREVLDQTDYLYKNYPFICTFLLQSSGLQENTFCCGYL